MSGDGSTGGRVAAALPLCVCVCVREYGVYNFTASYLNEDKYMEEPRYNSFASFLFVCWTVPRITKNVQYFMDDVRHKYEPYNIIGFICVVMHMDIYGYTYAFRYYTIVYDSN